jgi:hypothetical protein
MENGGGISNDVASLIVSAFIALGPAGLFCLVLLAWIYFREKRINELTDKLIDVGSKSIEANVTSAAASNRLADMLSMTRRGTPGE